MFKRHSLSFLIPFVIFALGSILFVIDGYFVYKNDRAQMVGGAVSAAKIMGRGLSAEIERMSLHRDDMHPELVRTIAYLALDNLDEVRIYSKDEMLFRQRMVASEVKVDGVIIGEVLQNLLSTSKVDLDNEKINLYVPVFLPKTTTSLEVENGVILLSFSLSQNLEMLSHKIWHDFERQLIKLIVLTILLSLFLHFLVFKRIQKLQEASKRLIENDFSYQLPTKGNDEITHINSAFNEMSQVIQSAQQKLEQQILQEQQTNQQLEEHKDALEKASLAKSRFLSSMSHELRTPLNAVLGFSQLLELSDLNKDQKDHLNNILDGGEHLLRLINQVLDLSKIEAGDLDLEIEPLAVNKILDETVVLLQPLLDKHQVSIDIAVQRELDYKICADYTAVKQVFINFISNAVKYNHQGGWIKVDAVLIEQQDAIDKVKVIVEDSGIGIPESQQGNVFEAFNRLGHEGKTIEGTGIGLSICKNLVESMGGEIGFSSQQNVGSKFWVIFDIEC